MIIQTDNRIASAYAESFYRAIMEKPDLETTKCIAETTEMLLSCFYGDTTRNLTYRNLCAVDVFAKKMARLQEPISKDDEYFVCILKKLIENGK